ncbi:hypothetical protein EJ04DRAFT_48435 [Polyplosphaeria fusca]|uniref:Uncharacterized protein n=1 Tax=Polyplosphaeria fusca TaxID=682080 RepID=A0A9P4UYM6_9PLEO|nr:hypothetical protein EJ04DRAFT_48435 [Polyplosphaeria fusca]
MPKRGRKTRIESTPNIDDASQSASPPLGGKRHRSIAPTAGFAVLDRGPSFFDDTNFDVRMAIYEYMNFRPLSEGNEYHGFVMSCRQAHEETSEAAGRQLAAYFERFAEAYYTSTGLYCTVPKIPIYGGWKELMTVTITLPVEALKGRIPALPTLDPEFDVMRKRFDKITFLYTGTVAAARALAPPARQPYPIPQSVILKLATSQSRWLKNVNALFNSVCMQIRSTQIMLRPQNDRTIAFIEFTAVHTRVKCVAIAWDFTPPPSRALRTNSRKPGPVLQGFCYNLSQASSKAILDSNKLDKKGDVLPYKYELVGKGGLTGECGLYHDSRFLPLKTEPKDVWHWLREGEKIRSQGIGKAFG